MFHEEKKLVKITSRGMKHEIYKCTTYFDTVGPTAVAAVACGFAAESVAVSR